MNTTAQHLYNPYTTTYSIKNFKIIFLIFQCILLHEYFAFQTQKHRLWILTSDHLNAKNQSSRKIQS